MYSSDDNESISRVYFSYTSTESLSLKVSKFSTNELLFKTFLKNLATNTRDFTYFLKIFFHNFSYIL
jgi:hypothetical protein